MSFFIRLRETFAVPPSFRERVTLRRHRIALDNTWQQSRSTQTERRDDDVTNLFEFDPDR